MSHSKHISEHLETTHKYYEHVCKRKEPEPEQLPDPTEGPWSEAPINTAELLDRGILMEPKAQGPHTGSVTTLPWERLFEPHREEDKPEAPAECPLCHGEREVNGIEPGSVEPCPRCGDSKRVLADLSDEDLSALVLRHARIALHHAEEAGRRGKPNLFAQAVEQVVAEYKQANPDCGEEAPDE